MYGVMRSLIRRRMVWIGATRAGIARASTTLRGLHWFEVGEIRGHITESRVGRYQVRLQVGSG